MDKFHRIFTSDGWVISYSAITAKETRMLKKFLEELKDAVYTAPHPALKLAAMYLMLEYDRDDLPDWVEALANGNPQVWEAVIDVVRGEIKADEER